jgi:hypothetical protein
MTDYVLGSMVFFTATFVDKAGAPASPVSASVYLVYHDKQEARQKVTISMALEGNVASASWDSSVAKPGLVSWSTKGVGSNAIVQDGSFMLTANEANHDADSDA